MITFDGHGIARTFAHHEARLQHQASGERAQRDIDAYNEIGRAHV